MSSLYGEYDPRDIPAYSIGDAARYLRIPSRTVRSWTIGQNYAVKKGQHGSGICSLTESISSRQNFFRPIIDISKHKPYLLSFTNLVEVHVLRAIRQHHNIQLNKVREALDIINREFPVPHPLAKEDFRTNGIDLFIERYGELINASSGGKKELRVALEAHLERIEPDDSGLAIKLYPFTRSQEAENPRLIVIDPRIAFGRLVIAETGIPTDILKERYQAGESMEELAEDYDCDRLAIEEAIRCELPVAA